jgi:hypothetical protein
MGLIGVEHIFFIPYVVAQTTFHETVGVTMLG